MNRVVITGMGAVSPLGNTFMESWEAVKSGISGLGPITKFDASDMPWKLAGELKGFEAVRYLAAKEVRRLDPFIHYSVAASVMALEDAGLGRTDTGPDEYIASGGVIIGSSRGGISTIEDAIVNSQITKEGRRHMEGKKKTRLSAFIMPSTTISMASSYVAQKIGMRGYCLGISNACASGANAIGEAFRLIRGGYGGPIIAGGSEAPVCRFCFEGYGAATVLSRKSALSASRPFDRSRDGFVISEGACVMVLENLFHAVKRGAEIYGEITGYANTTDGFHQTRPDREGEALAVRSAIAEAGITSEDIDYINAHATSTLIGDRVEAETIEAVFGKRASTVPVSALKSMTGHMLAASAAFETALTLMSIKTGFIPPTINLTEKETCCRLNVITEPVRARIGTAITQSFGFGGVNAVIVARGL